MRLEWQRRDNHVLSGGSVAAKIYQIQGAVTPSSIVESPPPTSHLAHALHVNPIDETNPLKTPAIQLNPPRPSPQKPHELNQTSQKQEERTHQIIKLQYLKDQSKDPMHQKQMLKFLQTKTNLQLKQLNKLSLIQKQLLTLMMLQQNGQLAQVAQYLTQAHQLISQNQLADPVNSQRLLDKIYDMNPEFNPLALQQLDATIATLQNMNQEEQEEQEEQERELRQDQQEKTTLTAEIATGLTAETATGLIRKPKDHVEYPIPDASRDSSHLVRTAVIKGAQVVEETKTLNAAEARSPAPSPFKTMRGG